MTEQNSSSFVFDLNQLTVPDHVSHIKTGHTIATNGRILLVQDGPTTLEFAVPPKFDMKKIPWKFGLLRDLVWSEELSMFILLTKSNLYGLQIGGIADANSEPRLSSLCYSKIIPSSNDKSFWRCMCVGSTVYISYSGFGTPIDEYTLTPWSCEFIQQWKAPTTCSESEGIWSMRFHPKLNLIGWSVVDSETNGWRFEIRQPKTLKLISQTTLPYSHGDCEVTPLENGDWLMINSIGILFLNISGQQIKQAVEYERELRNAILWSNKYFVVRTKSTIDFHKVKKPKAQSK